MIDGELNSSFLRMQLWLRVDAAPAKRGGVAHAILAPLPVPAEGSCSGPAEKEDVFNPVTRDHPVHMRSQGC